MPQTVQIPSGGGQPIKTVDLEVKAKFKYNPWLCIIDQTIRIFFSYLYFTNLLNLWTFLSIQAVLLIIVGYLNSEYEDKLNKKYRSFLNPKYKEKIKIIYDDSIPNFISVTSALSGFIFTFWLMYHSAANFNWYNYLFFFVFALIGSFIFLVNSFMTIRIKESKGMLSFQVFETGIENGTTTSKDVTKNYQDIFVINVQNKGDEVINLDSVDYNDTRIARLESELKSTNHKVDAWMMESVFLGGLAFSGFLTVAAANFLGNETAVFREFTHHIAVYLDHCKHESFTSWFNQIQKVFLRNDLYILIMLLCLMSSVFFLLVLTLRLRLNSLSLNMDHLIRIMTIFNAKEEELYNMQYESTMNKIQKGRLETIGKKIDAAITDADKLLKDLKPTATMMSIYRNLAVFLFYLVLIVSGFYFMPIIAALILALAIFTQIFRLLETYSKLGKIRSLIRRH